MSSRLALRGNVAQIYDDRWFQEQIRLEGINQLGKFSPFPPPTVLIMIPFTMLDPLNALRAWTILNIAILVVTIPLLSRTTGGDWLSSSLLILASGQALANNFRFGQFYLFLAFLLLCAVVLQRRGQTQIAGLILGVGGAVKYFPVLFLPVMVVQKQWKAILAFSAAVIGLYGASVALLGLEVHARFFNSVFLHHLSGNIQNPFSATFQSWNSLFRRLFIVDESLNPQPLLNWPPGYILSLSIVYGSVLWLTIWAFKKVRLDSSKESFEIQFALLSVAGLLLLPASATYHFLLLTLPVAILLGQAKEHWSIGHTLLLVLYATIGFLPYRLVSDFDGKGYLTVLAYPRLFTMAGIFSTTLYVISAGSRRSSRTP